MNIRPIFVLASLFLATAVHAEDWPQFRGPLGKGISEDKSLPLEWSRDKNVRWRVELPAAGNSSPIVSNGRVFVTVAENKGKKRSLLSIDRSTGDVLWTRSVEFSGDEPTHKTNPYCGSTPCADGERVYVWHSSAGLVCYDFAGEELWSRDLGDFKHIWGYGSSPIIYGDLVILNCGPSVKTFLIALSKKTGETVWQQDEEGGSSTEWVGSWSTPLVAKIDGKDQILVSYPGHVKAYEPTTGKVIWTCRGLGTLSYSDVAIGIGIGVATTEDEAGESIGFRLGGSGDVTDANRLWAKKRPLEVSTGVVVEGYLWSVDNGGVLRCTNMESGEIVLKKRAPHGPAWGSMLQVGDRVFYTSKSGETVVFSPDQKKFEVVQVNSLGEPSNSTPAFSDGEIFLRTHAALYCVSAK